MKNTLALAALLLVGTSQAQIYKCDGTYQQTPCGDGVDATVDIRAADPPASAASAAADVEPEYKARAREVDWRIKVRLAIERGEPLVGMTLPELRRALGQPHHVNRSQVGGSIRDQNVYENREGTWYVYTDAAAVTGVQWTPSLRPRQRCPSPFEMREIEMDARSAIQSEVERKKNVRRLEAARKCLRQQ